MHSVRAGESGQAGRRWKPQKKGGHRVPGGGYVLGIPCDVLIIVKTASRRSTQKLEKRLTLHSSVNAEFDRVRSTNQCNVIECLITILNADERVGSTLAHVGHSRDGRSREASVNVIDISIRDTYLIRIIVTVTQHLS